MILNSFRLQKRCIKMITNSKRRESSKPLFKTLNVLPIRELYESKLSIFVHKFLKNELPSVFSNFFSSNSAFHNYSTRNATNFRLPIVKTEVRKHSIRCMAINVYNEMRTHVNFEDSLYCFKRSVKEHLLKR